MLTFSVLNSLFTACSKWVGKKILTRLVFQTSLWKLMLSINCFSGRTSRTISGFQLTQFKAWTLTISIIIINRESWIITGVSNLIIIFWVIVTYRCYASEQCGSNPPPVSVTTFAINDGERVCCNGTFASWDVSSSPTGGSSCAMCPGMYHCVWFCR